MIEVVGPAHDEVRRRIEALAGANRLGCVVVVEVEVGGLRVAEHVRRDRVVERQQRESTAEQDPERPRRDDSARSRRGLPLVDDDARAIEDPAPARVLVEPSHERCDDLGMVREDRRVARDDPRVGSIHDNPRRTAERSGPSRRTDERTGALRRRSRRSRQRRPEPARSPPTARRREPATRSHARRAASSRRLAPTARRTGRWPRCTRAPQRPRTSGATV